MMTTWGAMGLGVVIGIVLGAWVVLMFSPPAGVGYAGFRSTGRKLKPPKGGTGTVSQRRIVHVRRSSFSDPNIPAPPGPWPDPPPAPPNRTLKSWPHGKIPPGASDE